MLWYNPYFATAMVAVATMNAIGFWAALSVQAAARKIPAEKKQ